MVLGVKLLQQNYMQAYDFYAKLGDFYFSLVTKNKGILPAVKTCYIIAAENLYQVRGFIAFADPKLQINPLLKDEEKKEANKKKINEIITL